MNQSEFDDGPQEQRSQAVECFCGCGVDQLRARAWVATDQHQLAYSDAVEFRILVEPHDVLWRRRFWARLALAWRVLWNGEFTLSWVEGKVADWHAMAHWLLAIQSLTADQKQEVYHAEAEERQARKDPWPVRFARWQEGVYWWARAYFKG
ncbi:MAG: hypothetical protein ABFE07_28880 [Armatimonadia bacterium]